MKSGVRKLVEVTLLLLLFIPAKAGIFSSNNSKVIARYNKALNDEFYFIRGLDRERSLSTNIKYRGLLYSKKMKEAGVRGFLEIGIENLDDIVVYGTTYRSVLAGEEVNKIFEDEAKKFFGDKILLQNTTDGYFSKGSAEAIKKKFTKVPKDNKGKTLEEILDSKGGFRQTFVTVFVKDIKKIDELEYRKKALDLANYMFDNLNVTTSLQIFIRDESYLEDYEKIESTIAPGFREDKEIKEILEKVKKKEAISEAEKLKLLSVMYRYFRDWNNLVEITIFFKRKEHFPLEIIYTKFENGKSTWIKNR